MKTRITANFRPLLRAFYPFLIAIAVLWAVPKNAQAQLYVTNRPGGGAGVVSEYNATTGAVIKHRFIKGLSNNGNFGLIVYENNLFVSDNSGFVGKYVLPREPRLAQALSRGRSEPAGLRILSATLFVANFGSGTVGTYNSHLTGAAINANLITGLNQPLGLVVLEGVPNNPLFVATFDTVGAYNSTTGAAINASFITGLDAANGLARLGNTLFVANFGSNKVGAYDATTGAAIDADFITGLNHPVGLAVLKLSSTLFVANNGSGTVGAYNGTTGAAINANFITGLTDVFAVAVKQR